MINQACNLTIKHCVPCEGGVVPLTKEEFAPMLAELKEWIVVEDKKIEKEYSFQDFGAALQFINRLGKTAESEGHHPDIYLHDFNKIKLILWTHAIKGLSENDFIVAAKIDEGEKYKPS